MHFVFERLFGLDPAQRTLDSARQFTAPALEEICTPDVRRDLKWDEELEERLLREADEVIERYFLMEDPRAVVTEGIEMRVSVTVDGTPMFGILDRLDRDEDGSLVIVDYKTGATPKRDYDAQTFANAELYAVLCEEKTGERPQRIRLLYVKNGDVLERFVSPVILKARRDAASSAWRRINEYYEAGFFPATPSKSACRFCAYQDLCRSNGVPVP